MRWFGSESQSCRLRPACRLSVCRDSRVCGVSTGHLRTVLHRCVRTMAKYTVFHDEYQRWDLSVKELRLRLRVRPWFGRARCRAVPMVRVCVLVTFAALSRSAGRRWCGLLATALFGVARLNTLRIGLGVQPSRIRPAGAAGASVRPDPDGACGAAVCGRRDRPTAAVLAGAVNFRLSEVTWLKYFRPQPVRSRTGSVRGHVRLHVWCWGRAVRSTRSLLEIEWAWG